MFDYGYFLIGRCPCFFSIAFDGWQVFRLTLLFIKTHYKIKLIKILQSERQIRLQLRLLLIHNPSQCFPSYRVYHDSRFG